MNANILSKHDASPNFHSLMQVLLQRCKCGTLFPDAKYPFSEMQMQVSMMQVSFAGMQMQSLFMMMQMSPCGDANAIFYFFNIKCPLWVCYDANAPLWVCHDANASLWVCHDANTN